MLEGGAGVSRRARGEGLCLWRLRIAVSLKNSLN